MKSRFAATVLLGVLWAISMPQGGYASTADTLAVNGKIYTVNINQPWAEAVAVSGNKIVYVGDNAGAAAFVGDGTKKIDLKGRMVLPGFVESHIHIAMGGPRLPG